MNIKVEKIETNVVKMEIVVPAEKFEEAVKKSYKKNSGKFNIPGFRKGKAPKSVIEQYYGEGVFYDDAIEIVIDETYPVAIKQESIVPVDYPKIDIAEIGKGKDFIYIAEVTLRPEVKLGDYKGVTAVKPSYEVTDEDVESQLNMMREKNARIVSKEEGAVENGDIAVIDFEGFVDGVAFEGGKGEGYELTIGSGSFIPGFEDQLVGAKVGDEVDVNVTFPEEYQEESLKAKPALFKVKVNSIKVKELPELDDEFVKDVSEFDTLDELKSDIRSKSEEANNARADREFQDEVLKKVVDAAEIEIPEVMVEKEIEFMLKDYDYRLRYQGFTLEKYVELLGISIEKLKEDFKEPALNRVRTDLVLEAIGKAEGLTATEEELNNRAEEIAKSYGSKDIEKIKKNILDAQRQIIEGEIVNNKVVDLLVKESKAE